MKIAIATFENRVSPRFDCARSALLITINEGTVSECQEIAIGECSQSERVDRLFELNVDTVICGSIDRWSVALFQSAGITVYGWVAADVEDALTALLKGDLDAEAAMGGSGCCVCQRFPGQKVASPGLGTRYRGGRRL